MVTEEELRVVLTKRLGLRTKVSIRRFSKTCGAPPAILAALCQRNGITLEAFEIILTFAFLKCANLNSVCNMFKVGEPRVAETWKRVCCEIALKSREVRI